MWTKPSVFIIAILTIWLNGVYVFPEILDSMNDRLLDSTTESLDSPMGTEQDVGVDEQLIVVHDPDGNRFTMKHLLSLTRLGTANLLYVNSVGKVCSMCQRRNSTIYKNAQLLNELTGCTQKRAYEILKKNNTFAKMDQERIRKATAVVKKLGFNKEDLFHCIEILSKHPLTIETHFKILEEGGFIKEQLSLIEVYRYLTFVRRKISVLKLHGLIAEADDVTQNFCSHTMMPKSQHPPSSNDETLFQDAQSQVMEAFLCWRLSLSKDELKKLTKVYSSILRRSIRETKLNLDILEKDISFTKEKICNHAYLIQANADNIISIMKNVKKLGSTDIIIGLHMVPKILVTPVDAVLKIQQHLKEFNVADEAVNRSLNVFTLSPESVYNRLKYLQSVPQLAAFLHHPLTLRLVLHQRKATERLELLSKMNIKCASLHVLSTADNLFNKYAEKGQDRTRGDDITRFLGGELKMDRKEIRSKLQRHPFWYHVPITTIKTSLDYLRREQFSDKEIFESIQLLLYPIESIMQELNVLERRPGIEYCKAEGESKIRRETILPLVMYYIEQQHNFSGEGIWLHHEAEENKTRVLK